MEIFNYLHLTTTRLFVVLGLAFAAAIPTAVLLSSESESFQTEAVVVVSRALPASRTAFEITPFVGDLETTLGLDPVVDEIAAASGVERADFDLATERSADGFALTVTATATLAADADRVAVVAPQVAMTTLLDQELRRAQRVVDARQLRLTDVQADLERFRAENETRDPVEEYRLAGDGLSFARSQLLNTNLDAAQRAELTADVAEFESELERLAPLLSDYGQLSRAEVDAESGVSDARQNLIELESLISGAAVGDFVVTTPATPVSGRETTMTGVIVAILFVGALSIAAFAVVDARRARVAQAVTARRGAADDGGLDDTDLDDTGAERVDAMTAVEGSDDIGTPDVDVVAGNGADDPSLPAGDDVKDAHASNGDGHDTVADVGEDGDGPQEEVASDRGDESATGATTNDESANDSANDESANDESANGATADGATDTGDEATASQRGDESGHEPASESGTDDRTPSATTTGGRRRPGSGRRRNQRSR